MPRLSRTLLLPLPVLLAAVAIGSEFGFSRDASARSVTQAAAVSSLAASPAATGSTTAQTVAAAQALKVLLSTAQKQQLQFSFTSSKRTGWEIHPIPVSQRTGLALSSMTATQQAAALKLARMAMGNTGYQQWQSVRLADAHLATLTKQFPFGYNHYWFSIFGTPSTSGKWTLQIAGHHFARNITFTGAVVSPTPSFKGVEPLSFTINGKTVNSLKREATALKTMLASLTTTQRTSAKLSQVFDDVLLGPGQDGKFPARQGVLVSSLSSPQRALVTNVIKAWVNDADPTTAARLLKEYTSEYSKTRVAYAGSTSLNVQGSYARIDGPHVWIEFVVQNGVVTSGIHYHAMFRDHTADYGG